MKKSLLQDSMDFIFDNFLNITLFILFLVLYSGYIITHGLLEKKSHSKLKRVVVIENMRNREEMQVALRNGFCKSTLSDNNLRQQNCEKLSQSNCNVAECCVYAKEHGSDIFNCVAGNKGGPTFISNPPVDEYYYLGKLHKRGKK